MDSAVQLALMSKAKKVFGADDTFLSFPVSPLPHTRRQLDFFAQQDADALRQSLQNLAGLFNAGESDPQRRGVAADGNALPLGCLRTSAEGSEFRVLVSHSRGGSGVSAGPRLPARSRRRAARGRTARRSRLTDSIRMPICWLNRNISPPRVPPNAPPTRPSNSAGGMSMSLCSGRRSTRCKRKWIIAGHKNEVETAQSKVMSLGARSPMQTWTEWNSRFNREIDTLTGAADNFTVFPSVFSPSNALEEGAWKPFKLSEQEVKVLLNEAPAELRSRFGADSAASSVASLTFEFSSAAILRPWFVSEALRARFWRFADASKILSDGGTPPKGTCPAYVTAIVFARRVSGRRKARRGGTGNQAVRRVSLYRRSQRSREAYKNIA